MANEQRENTSRSQFDAAILVIGMFIGFLLGFLLHDYLVDKTPVPHDMKSWYPR